MDIYSPIGNEPATSAYVVVNGTTPYADDSDVAMCEDVAYSISASITDGVGYYYDFAHWYVVGGSVGNDYSASTTLTPGAPLTNGVIVMVVGESGVLNWGGYIGGGSHITSADGTFTVPSGPYAVVGPCSDTDELPMWVGIGGLNGNASMWQAGVTAKIPGSSGCTSSVEYTAWYEALPAASVPVPLTVCTNEPFTVDLTLNGTGAWATFGSCGSYTAHVKDFVPDETTAEWVVESPGLSAGDPFMNFPTIDFGVGTYYDGGRGTTLSGPSAPLMEWTATDQVLENVLPYYLYQFANPSYYSTGGFSVSYSQQSSL